MENSQLLIFKAKNVIPVSWTSFFLPSSASLPLSLSSDLAGDVVLLSEPVKQTFGWSSPVQSSSSWADGQTDRQPYSWSSSA